MNALLMILSLLSALLPLADRGMQYAQQRQTQKVEQVEQPRVVYHNGRWWKWDGQTWWVWTPTQVAQGGSYVYH